jgi:RNA polymerase sigma factor (sigma-70 family)
MRSEDAGIIHECLNGETEAFGLLVDKYKEGIYAFVYGKLRDFQNAQDVTQEVFLQAYRDLRSLRRWESFVFWLYRIASTRCKMWIRTQSRRVDREFIEDQDSTVIDDSSLDSYRDSQLGESLEEALDSLPEMQREVLMLHYFGGMNSKEIAKAIGTSPGAVRMRLTRARSQLREEMLTMMDTAFEGQRIPAGFTLRIVEAVKHIKVHPMPRMTGLPWGLSLAAGIIVTVLSLNPQMNITSDMAIPAGSPLPVDMKVLRTGEISVDILKTSEISIIAIKQEDGDNESLDPQNALSMAPRAEEGSWARKEGMPTARAGLSTSVVNGIIYAIGGTTKWASMDHRTVEAYDPAEDSWTKKADMPTARGGLSTSVVNGIIYAIGGWDENGKTLSTVEAYDPATDTWTKKADMQTSRAYPSTSVVDGIIYAIGGWHENVLLLSTVEAYDPVADAWTTKEDMPTARGALSTSVVNGLIYAIGGMLYGSVLSTVEVYDPATDTWTTKADMPTARWALSTSVVNRMIYAIGGRIGEGEKNGVSVPTVEVYNPVTDTWTEKADMPTKRGVHSTSAVNGHIYVIGGWIDAATVLVEEYDPGSIAVEPREKLPTTWGKSKSR